MRKFFDWLKKAYVSAKSWVAVDGFQHICVCSIIVFALGWIKPLWVAPTISLVIGILKEFVDVLRYMKYNGGSVEGFNWKHSLHDLACDCIGIVLGCCLVVLHILAWRV